jgi:hypothetical protein
MPRVIMHVSGKAVGATDQQEAFAEMVRTTIAGVSAGARSTVRVGAEDQVTIEVTCDRDQQIGIGEELERLLAHAEIRSEVIEGAAD